jgi:hypothetical protein
MKTGATLVGVAAILAVLGYFGLQAFDRYEQHEARRIDADAQAKQLEVLRLQNALMQRQIEAIEISSFQDKALSTCPPKGYSTTSGSTAIYLLPDSFTQSWSVRQWARAHTSMP